MNVTSRQVRGLTAHLCKKYKTKIVDKGDAREMRIVAQALELMQIMDAERFMEGFATTLPPARFLGIKKTRIYLPFEPGETGKGALGLKEQIRTIAHEHHHAAQINSLGAPKFSGMYTMNPSLRGWLEARALHTELEVAWALSRRLPNLGQTANMLRFYKIDADGIRAVREHLEIVASVIRRGKVHNQVAKDTIRYLKRRSR